ncbi:MAG: hypothetical protein LBS62_14630 [Clostridiales bacterium]|jgi:hypothetical protein|nr:hypothetical protein [Clostridiales bacterium]
MPREYIKGENDVYTPIADTQGLLIPSTPKHIELIGTLVDGYHTAGQVYLNPFSWEYSPTSDRSIPIHFSGAHPNSGNPFLHFDEPGLYEITLINRTFSNSAAYPEARIGKWVISGYISETPTLANSGITSDGVSSTVKTNVFPKNFFFSFDAKDSDYCVCISGEYNAASYAAVTNNVIVEIRITQVAVNSPYLVANKGALVSGGAFQFDTDGNGYTENYSTEEIKVGTWVDGKPIYKKTWYRDNVEFASDAAILFISFPEATTWIERIIRYDMTFARAVVVGEATTGITKLKLL